MFIEISEQDNFLNRTVFSDNAKFTSVGVSIDRTVIFGSKPPRERLELERDNHK
jgi:hypothetical protein